MNDLSKSFSILTENRYLSIAEFTLMLEEHEEEIWYYFSRINVPKPVRNRGIGNSLMKEAIEWADDAKVNILCEINPYGDLNLEELIKFYAKFGFESINKITMVRMVT